MPSLFSIDDDNMRSEELADFLLFMLNEDRIPIPPLTLAQILSAKTRPGLSADQTHARVVSRFPEAGIPVGPLNNGSANVMELFSKVMIEEIFDAIQNDMRVDVAVDPGILGQGVGSNAGGPIVTTNTTLKPHTATGVAR